jgi:Heterokaryon incompatibility protein (HET)
LPDSWEAFQALGGRILFIHKDLVGTTSTLWERPDPNYASFNVAKETDEGEALAQVSVYESLLYIWGFEDNPLEVPIETSNSTDDIREVLVETPGSTSPQKYAKLSVRQNLEGSLRHLRYTHTTRTLWIDAVCINQSDVSERNKQVALMKDIFRLAERVTVWLGPATGDSWYAIETLDYLGKQVVYTKDRRRAPAPDAVEGTWFQPTCQLPFEDSTWKTIGDLLRRPWFERLLVVQEAHLARKGVFLCGDDELDWLAFRYAILVFWYNKASLWSLPSTMRLIGQLAESIPEKHPISDVLYQVYGRSCTDPRDCVYGIHGLFPRSFQELIQPDYSLLVGGMYKDMTIAHINYYRLELL